MNQAIKQTDPHEINQRFIDALCDLLNCEQTPAVVVNQFLDAAVEVGNQMGALRCDTEHIRHVLSRSLNVE